MAMQAPSGTVTATLTASGGTCGISASIANSANNSPGATVAMTNGGSGNSLISVALIQQLTGAGGTMSIGATFQFKSSGGATTTLNTGVLAVTNTFTANTFYPFSITWPCVWQTGGTSDHTIVSGENLCASSTVHVSVAVVCTTQAGANICFCVTNIRTLTFTTGALSFVDDIGFVDAPISVAVGAQVCKQATSCGSSPGSVTGWTGDITGFQVDPQDNIVIARTADGTASTSKIRAFNSVSLTQIGASPVQNGCNRADGVMAYTEFPPGRYYTGYMDCTTSAAFTDRFSIRGADLNSPDQSGTICAGTINCDIDIHGWPGSSSGSATPCVTSAVPTPTWLPPNSGQISVVSAFPISWSAGHVATGFAAGSLQSNGDYVFVGYAYTDTSSGHVGVFVIKQIHNNPDLTCSYEMPFAPGGQIIPQLCTFHFEGGANTTATGDYIVASGSNAAAGRMWNVQLTNAGTSDNSASPQLQMTQAGPGLRTGLTAVGCSATNDVITMGADGVIQRIHVLQGPDLTKPSNWVNKVPQYHTAAVVGQIAWTGVQGVTNTNRGLAVDQSGNYFAYLSSSTTVTIANGTNGQAMGTVTIPSTGTFVGMNLGRNGQVLYVATTTTIARYELAKNGVVPVLCETCNADGTQANGVGTTIPTGTGTGTTGGPTSTGSFVGSFITPFLGDLGSMGSLILGLIIIGAFVAAGVIFTKGRRDG